MFLKLALKLAAFDQKKINVFVKAGWELYSMLNFRPMMCKRINGMWITWMEYNHK
uniref:Uncharacterized protein n=1 Tax=Rhizophora mucronata TaxID=61149 RepID=A0A2P2ISU9_RHIMU